MHDKPTYEELEQEITRLRNMGLDRHRVEVLLGDEADWRRLLIEQSRDGIIIADLEGRIVLVNNKFADMVGCTADEIVNGYIWDIDKRYLEVPVYDWLNSIDSTGVLYESSKRKKNGDIIEVEVSNNAVFYKGQKFILSLCRDISERKAMENALRESEERLKSIISTSQEWIWITDTHGVYTFSNPAVEKILGCRPDEITGKSASTDLIHEDDIHMAISLFKKSVREKTGWTNIVVRFKHRDGNIRYLESSATPILDPDGELKGFQGADRDITSRQQAEDAIRKSETLYRIIFENTATANIIIDENRMILMANNNFVELSGYTKEQLEGRLDWSDFVHGDDVSILQRYHHMRRMDPDSVPGSYEIRSIGRRRGIRNLLMNVSIIPGTKNSIISIIDITEWKRTEEEKRASETRFEEFADLLPETFFETDIDGTFTFINNQGFKRFGYSRDDMKNLSIFDVVVPEDHPRASVRLERLMRGESSSLGEYTARRKNGSTFPVLIHATTIYGDEKPVGTRGFVIDISEKKNLENQLIRAQKMEAIGTLAGGIAHDFNNLLAGILGNISLILMKFEEDNPVYTRLKKIEEYVRRGSSLTGHLLGFARGGKYEVKPTDIGLFIGNSLELFGHTRKEIRIYHRAREGLWTVEIDQGQMEQVLLNLFLNASQAMPDGGALFISEENVELDRDRVIPHRVEPGRYVRIAVADTGIGMDEAVKKRIFEPFFTTKPAGQGSGLGLASAYGIIKNHGGFIHVESVKNEGTTFIIYLPASDVEAGCGRDTKSDLNMGRETILVIDDESMILDVTCGMLQEMGYSVISSQGGSDGIDLYRKNMERIDLVILDMIMPDYSGTEMFDAITGLNPSVKILLSSGYSIDSQARDLLQRGCGGFIQKPFLITELSAKIREILDR